MTGSEHARARTCPRCGRRIAPRGGKSPGYCAVCGCALAPPQAEVPYVTRQPASSPPAATAALILGLCSFVPMCGLPLGVLAIVLGVSAKREIDRSNGRLGGRGMATAGFTLGIITSALWTLVCLGVR